MQQMVSFLQRLRMTSGTILKGGKKRKEIIAYVKEHTKAIEDAHEDCNVSTNWLLIAMYCLDAALREGMSPTHLINQLESLERKKVIQYGQEEAKKRNEEAEKASKGAKKNS